MDWMFLSARTYRSLYDSGIWPKADLPVLTSGDDEAAYNPPAEDDPEADHEPTEED